MNSSEMQGAVAEEVNRRLAKATQELGEMYARGEGGMDQSVDGPTGQLYKDQHMQDMQRKQQRQQQRASNREAANQASSKAEDIEAEDDGEDEDYELRQIRAQRLKQLQQSQRERVEHIGKGHGQYREIVQDEFLAEMTGSLRVICHFYHRDFPRCEIMHMHLQKLAARHIETKFVKINADKAPFFVDKLKVRSLPTVVLFVDGIAKDKLVGFEGLADGQEAGKEDEWPTVRLARLLASKDMLRKDLIQDEEREQGEQQAKLSSLRQAMISSALDEDDELFE